MMEFKRLKVSTNQDERCGFPYRIVLLELKNNSSKYSTHIEVMPPGKDPYFIQGGYGCNLAEETEMFHKRVEFYDLKEDVDFKPEEEFSEA